MTNAPGTRLELWLSDLPKSWPAQRKELQQLSIVTGIPVAQILKKMRDGADDPLTPVVVQLGIHPDQITYIEEHESEFPGVQLLDSSLRKYRFQSLTAHVLGYVGPISKSEYKGEAQARLPADRQHRPDRRRGDLRPVLRGHDGTAQLTVDSRGRPTSAVETSVLPQPGNALRLTIDIDIQRAAERALTYGIDLAHARRPGRGRRGAIVAMDRATARSSRSRRTPRTSRRSTSNRGPEKLAPLQNEAVAVKDNHPALDRAIGVGYPPGSTWKPVTALAGDAGAHPLSVLVAALLAHLTVKGHRGQTFTNWDPTVNQWIDLKTALAESCDTYFYQVG